jgi:hypothetical protein
MTSIQFWRGRDLYQIAPAREGTGFIGLCSGRVVATAPDPASVMRALIKAAVWRRQKPRGWLDDQTS